MGPWTHKVDDGLETRKTAYETLYTLVRVHFRETIAKADWMSMIVAGHMPRKD